MRHIALTFLLVGSAASAAEPRDKADQLAAATGRADACFDDQVPKLDDGVSPADTIARAVVTACRNYVDDISAIQIKGRNYWYKQAYPAQQLDASKQKVTLSVLRHRTGK